MIGLVVVLVLALLAGGFIWLSVTRKQARRFKDIERSLKMVPLLIHLPPTSDDIKGGGRDVRDVTEENISKAQVLYGVISSTIQKGTNAKRYGQRHLAFEVVTEKGFVHFYAAVPLSLVGVVKQAIVSAYPSARLEEAPDHNIFNSNNTLTGIAGGELVLKESYAYPIATYQELKRDTMQALFNSLSGVEQNDGAAIQILIRPAEQGWIKTVRGLAEKKKKGDDKQKSALQNMGALLKDASTALTKPPEHKDSGGGDKPKELSSLDQSVIDMMYDKTRSAGFEVLIRLVASSGTQQRAHDLVGNMVASFALFDASGRNGFKFESVPSDKLVGAYLLRSFPYDKHDMVLNSVELATLYHFPDQQNTPTSQLSRQSSKQVDGPRNMPDEGLFLGYNLFRGAKKPIRLALGDRQRHMYVVGQTGTGKSTFLENLAVQDMLSGGGFAFIDPHGDTAEKLLSMVPKERTEDVIYFCPADTDYPIGFNLFEFNDPKEKDFIIQEILNMLYKLYDPQRQGIMGPRYENIFRNAALAIMADPNGGTFVDVPKLFTDPDFLKEKLQHVKDPNVLDFWLKEYPASQRSNDSGEVTAWFVSKFGAFLGNEMMRNMIGQTKSAFDLREVMDNKKILIVNLSKGRTGDLNSKLLGMIFVMRFQAAAMSRSDIPESERKDFALYVDEFQNFSTDSFATIMSEARKYHLNLIVANQFTTQLTEEIRDAVFGNMGSVVAFRVGQNDVDALTRYFSPEFDAEDLLRVPNYNTVVRTLAGGVPTRPFSMATIPPVGSPNPKLLPALKQLSAAKYGRPKAQVEAEIFARLKPRPQAAPMGAPGAQGRPSGPAAAGNTARQSGAAPAPQRPAPAPQTGNFLDDWLAKKGQPAPAQAFARPTGPPQLTTNAPSAPQPTMVAPSAPAPQPFVSAPMPPAEPSAPLPAPKPTSSGEISLRSGAPAQTEDGTIYIDRDGNLHLGNEPDNGSKAG